VLLLPDADQRLIVYSAASGTPAGEALALLRVLGLQELPVDTLNPGLRTQPAGG